MRNGICKKALSLGLAVLITASSVFAAPATEVSAAAKAPDKITLSATKQTVQVGKKFTLKVKSVTPKTASKKVKFTTSNKKVATVTSKGVVKGIKAGSAKITVTSTEKKSVKATCKVTVVDIAVKNAVNGVLTVDKNKSVTIKPSVKPKSVAVAGYTYSIKNKKIASVTKKGKLTGLKAGKTTLTITTKKKNKSDKTYSLKLTVIVQDPSGDSQNPVNTETTNTQTPGSETTGTETPGSETVNTETPGSETAATETPGSETAATETPGSETAATETPGSETVNTETPGNDVDIDVDDPDAIQTWKFDFGSADDVASGYTAVTADKDYYASDNTDGYGFMGINPDSYRASDRFDGFGNQLGQVQDLRTGGGTGLNDAIGSVGILDSDGNPLADDQIDPLGDEYYPTRFALKVEDDTYYRVTAVVTTLDPSRDASATLYTERKHPIYTDRTIKAGQTSTVAFTIRVTPIYYEKSDPKGLIADGMVNVCVAGDNAALAALKIEQIKSAPTLWVLGDSTVTDGNTTLPFFRLQNYTGVGTGLTKYLPSDIAMVNEGEGGLAANDVNHYNVVKDRIKAGDWMYVEYGHNQSSVEEYTSCLEKYFETCKTAGANLLIVSPIERINSFVNNEYQHSLDAYARAGEDFVKEKIAAGETNIAFVDLNKTSYEFYNKVTADHDYDPNAIKFYFCTQAGGKTDTTHPNDAGAENLAYCFFDAAKAVTDETQKSVLSGLLTDMRDETPNPVPEDIITLGTAPNSAWPVYTVPIDEVYPVAIKDIQFDGDGNISFVKVKVQQAQTAMSAYGIIVVTISDENGNVKGTFYADDQVDNSTGYGEQTITNFRAAEGGGAALAEGDTYSVVVLKAHRDENNILVPDDDESAYSAVFTDADISDIDEYLLSGETGDTEDFNHFSQTELTGSGKWLFGGSSGKDLSLGKEADGRTYTNLVSTGGGSWCIVRAFENLDDGTGNTGSYVIEADFKYISGTNLKFSFVENTVNRFQAPFIKDAILDALVIGSNGAVTSHGTALTAAFTPNEWTHFRYVLNMDAGTAEITIGDNAAQIVNVPEFATFEDAAVSTFRYFSITQTENRSVFCAQLSNLTVAKLRDTGAEVTVTAVADTADGASGTVQINGSEISTANVSLASKVTFEAVPQGDSAFIGWYMGEECYSTDLQISLRAYKNIDLKAKFINGSPTNVIVNFKDKDGNSIKESETITEANGVALFENLAFTLDDSYKEQLKIADGTLTKVYLYNSTDSSATTITSMGALGSNEIDLVFDLDGIYDEFEDFSGDSLTPEHWGFTEGNSGNVALKEGALGLFINGAINKETSDVKELASDISSAKKLTVRFDWCSDAESGKGRYSLFDLKDSDGNIIFSLYGNGQKGITYAVNEAAGESSTKVASVCSNWIRVKLDIDFETKTISGTLVNIETGTETTIGETSLTEASNLATLNADYGYSLAPQRLDNFGIRYTVE